jgi:predicted transcriptional regulator
MAMEPSAGHITVPPDLIAQYDQVAELTGRARDDLMLDALRDFLAEQTWYLAAVNQGMASADAGRFVAAEEMEARWARWTQA